MLKIPRLINFLQGVPILSTQPSPSQQSTITLLGQDTPGTTAPISFAQLSVEPHSTSTTYMTNIYIVYMGHSDVKTGNI
jgi:hypothetical protein